MMDAYLDESGVHDDARVCVIAGFFGGSGKWKKFANDWRALLKRFDVPLAEFHAKDIFPKPRGFFHPTNWNGDHEAFRSAVAQTIAGHTKIHPVSAGIIVPDFKSFSQEERRFMTGATSKNGRLVSSGCPGKPYFVPFQHVVRTICGYAPVGGKAHFHFGLARPFAEYAAALARQIKTDDLQGGLWGWKDRLGRVESPLASQTPQLQAADFLANLTYHHMLDAGADLGIVFPSPLLQTCLENRLSQEDFFFSSEYTLKRTLDEAIGAEKFLRENLVLLRPQEL